MLTRIARYIPTIAEIKGRDNIMTVKDSETMLWETRRAAEILLRIRSTKDLVGDYILTGSMPMTLELLIARGSILEELQYRNPKAFIDWVNSEDWNDASLRKYF